jgi:hypothetical protein
MTKTPHRWADFAWHAAYLMWPITYAILVYDDLTHHETWNQRLMPIFTIDFIAALVWPGVWVYWAVQGILHHSSALTRLLGL